MVSVYHRTLCLSLCLSPTLRVSNPLASLPRSIYPPSKASATSLPLARNIISRAFRDLDLRCASAAIWTKTMSSFRPSRKTVSHRKQSDVQPLRQSTQDLSDLYEHCRPQSRMSMIQVQICVARRQKRHGQIRTGTAPSTSQGNDTSPRIAREYENI